jgi:hypothetical protein
MEDTQHYVFVLLIDLVVFMEVTSHVSMAVWWCAILLKVKWLLPLELMNGS